MRIRSGVIVLTFIGALAGAVGIGRATRRSPSENRPDPMGSVSSAEIEDIHGNVASLEAALAQTQERLKQVEANKKPVEAPAPPAPQSMRPQRPTPEQIAEARQKVLNEYRSRAKTFESEARDAAWAKREEDRISAASKTLLPAGAKIETVSCRASLCKFEIAFSKQEDQRPFGTAFANAMEAESLRGYHFDELERRPDGTYPLQVLLFREGYPMPGFSE